MTKPCSYSVSLTAEQWDKLRESDEWWTLTRRLLEMDMPVRPRVADEPEQLRRKLATSLLRRKHIAALLVQVVRLVEKYGAPAWRDDWLSQLKLHEQLIAADETTTGRIVTGKYCDHGIPISIECTECTAERRGEIQP